MKKITVKEMIESTVGEVSYYIDPSVREEFYDEEDQIEYIINKLTLKSGTVYYDAEFFEVTGITKKIKEL